MTVGRQQIEKKEKKRRGGLERGIKERGKKANKSGQAYIRKQSS